MQQLECAKARILIVDDQKPNLHVLRDLLHEHGEIILAKNGPQGIDKATKLKPDLVLLDVVMPEMDGFETLQALKRIEGLEDVPVMFITGLRDSDHEKKGLLMGALDYIRKPFNPAIVKARVETHLKLVQQNAVLKELSQRLQKADEAKSRFLATMSHEMRTPLTSIIGYAEALQSGDIPMNDAGKAMTSICTNSEHLLELINDILDMSKIEANQLKIEMLDVCLPKWLMDIYEIIDQRAKIKGLDCHLVLHYPLPTQIITDPTRLQQVLLNLLNNAVKFTMKGSVTLEVSCNTKQLEFNVVDTGIGIDDSQQESIFNAFTQAEMSTTRRFGGSGLGLNISQHLIQNLGGKISVESELGKGTCFTATAHLQTGQGNRWITDEESWRHYLCKGRSHQAWPTLSGKVLVAEDQPEIQQLVVMLLEMAGMEVFCVNDGQALLEEGVKSEYDLIVTDIQMPLLTGAEATKALRSKNVTLPIIALTANAMTHQKAEYRDAGFTDYISKPFSRQGFIQSITKHVPTRLVDKEELVQEISAETAKLASTFIASLPAQAERIKTCLEGEKWVELVELAHAITGAAGTFGFEALSQAAMTLEKALYQPNAEDKQQKTQSLIRLLHETHELAAIQH